MKFNISKTFILENYNAVLDFINMIKVGIFIADGNADVIMLNRESEKTGELGFEEVVGRNMTELERIGYVDVSSILKAIETRDEFTMVQNCKGDTSIYITATPFFNEEGEVDIVVCTERDITEIKELEGLLAESKKQSEAQKIELEYLRKKARDASDMVAASPQMQRILQTVQRIAQVDTTVMITGESGVGKEVIATCVYEHSRRAGKPFVKINCASIPESLLESELFGYEKGAFTGADAKGKAGIFEQTNGGTLFLDEISELSTELQAKLLRVLQEREIRRIGGTKSIKIDVRIIAATNINLRQAMEEGSFRKDLYYRLNVVPIEIPPLRERKADIRPLAEHFVNHFNKQHGTMKSIDDFAMGVLEEAEWKGNVRELQNVIERLMVSFEGMRITETQARTLLYPENPAMVSDAGGKRPSLKKLMDDYEKEILAAYLEECSTAAEAARRLGVDKSTMSRKMKKHGFE